MRTSVLLAAVLLSGCWDPPRRHLLLRPSEPASPAWAYEAVEPIAAILERHGFSRMRHSELRPFVDLRVIEANCGHTNYWVGSAQTQAAGVTANICASEKRLSVQFTLPIGERNAPAQRTVAIVISEFPTAARVTVMSE